jgi:hypothetical protein
MRYQLFTPEPDNGVTGNTGEYQPVLEDYQVQFIPTYLVLERTIYFIWE